VRFVLPEPAAARARAVADGAEPPVPLQPAATVVLLRDGPDGLQAYLQQRHSSLRFAAGMHAFPGGRVDPADADVPASLWVPPGPALWARRFGAPEAQAAAHGSAVVRVVFEETGLLLARAASAQPLPSWPAEADRLALSEHRVTLPDLLTEHGLRLDPADLVGWSRWLTPRFERRRFDTWFFVAALPAGATPRVATGESHGGRWVAVTDAVEQGAAGQLPMLPPTWWTLRELAAARDVAVALAHPPPMRAYTAGWVGRGDEVELVLPDDPAYPGEDPREGT
jgi:8-oxo-dGTP pyrophosphatase MutT (NUDIX family)